MVNAHPNGTGTIDPALIEAIQEQGYCFLVEHAEDADTLQRSELPALCLADGKKLTMAIVEGISEIIVVQRPGFSGTYFGQRIKRWLEHHDWQGYFVHALLPAEYPDLPSAERLEGERLVPFLGALCTDGLRERLGASEAERGPGRPRAPAASTLAETIAEKEQDTLAFDGRRRAWFAYGARQPGIWGELAEIDVQNRVRLSLNDLLPGGFSWRLLVDVEKLLRLLLSRELVEPSREWLPLLNGALHLPTGELHRHTPERGFTWCLPFAYDPEASCPTIDAWLLEAQDGDADRARVLLAYLRAMVLGRTDLQRFVECIGPGGTGKGSYQRLAMALIGLENTHITELRLLESNRFETAELAGKRLVVITDADKYGGPVNVLKELTGSDVLRSERKYADPQTLTHEAMVLVAANEPVQSIDYTSGLERRRLSVPFTHKPAVPRQLIDFHRRQARGAFVPELPGLLNQVLAISDAEMEALICQTTQKVPALQEAWKRTLLETNPLAHWADSWIILDSQAHTQVGIARRSRWSDGYEHESDWLYAHYRGMAEASGERPVSLRRFPRLLDDLLRHQLDLPDVGHAPERGTSYIKGVRLRTETDIGKPGLITAAIAARQEDPEGAQPPSVGNDGDSEGAQTRTGGELGDCGGFFEKNPQKNIAGENSSENSFRRNILQKSPTSPSIPTDAGLWPSPISHNPPRQGKDRNGWIWPKDHHGNGQGRGR
jgi:P4 family phage/plasmid primase-like protien